MEKRIKTQRTLLALRGLPASGKTTYAKTLEAEGWVRVEKDDIRLDVRLFPDGYNYKKGHEKKVIKERDRLIIQALQQGKNVVSSDTNFEPKHIKRLQAIAREQAVKFKLDDSFVKVPVKDCLDRDENRERSVGKSVILGMYYKYIHKGYFDKHPDWSEELPRAYLIDIDGTTAFMSDRSPYDLSKVINDTPNLAMTNLIDALCLLREGREIYDNKYVSIIFLSGREEISREATEEWLDKYMIEYDALYMRKAGDHRPDDIVKRELYEEYIKDKYNVLGVFDDRPKVVRMWRRELGLLVFQLADNDLEF